jgi:cullin-4
MVLIWDDYCYHIIILTRIFTFLDRTYVLQNTEEKSIWNLSLKEFCKIITSTQIKKILLNKITNLIEMEREGDSIEKDNIKKVIKMYHFLGIYELFEQIYFDETKIYYEKEAKEIIKKLKLSEYLQHVMKRIKQEDERSDYYLLGNTKKNLIKILHEKFVKEYENELIDKGKIIY